MEKHAITLSLRFFHLILCVIHNVGIFRIALFLYITLCVLLVKWFLFSSSCFAFCKFIILQVSYFE